MLATSDNIIFLRSLLRLGLPIALQNFLTSALSMTGTLMVGQLGDTAIAAVGLANQISFLLTLLLFGITSGAAIYTAQMWGKQDIANVRRVLGLTLSLALSGAFLFLILSVFFPEFALRIYSRDVQVVALGSRYLVIAGWGFLFAAVTYSYSAILRSIGDVSTPMLVSTTALGLNMVLNYTLIFGHFGFPQMGVTGAAVAALIARIMECLALLWIIYRRKSPLATHIGELFHINRTFARTVLSGVLPVALNEVLWSFGITTYNIFFARISTESIAAINIAASIESLAFVAFLGIGNACAIMVGNQIGAGEETEAYHTGLRSLRIGVVTALGVGAILLTLTNPILSLYKVSPPVIQYTRAILTIIAFFLSVRATNFILLVGNLRSGGDTRFVLYLESASMWLVGVTLAAFAAFVLKLPVYYVYLFALGDEVLKAVVAGRRFFSKRWIHNLVKAI